MEGQQKKKMLWGPAQGPIWAHIWALLRPIFGPIFGPYLGPHLGPGPGPIWALIWTLTSAHIWARAHGGPILGSIFIAENGPKANLTHMRAQNISTTSPGSKFRDLQVCQNPNGPKFGSMFGSNIGSILWCIFGPVLWFVLVDPYFDPFWALIWAQNGPGAKKQLSCRRYPPLYSFVKVFHECFPWDSSEWLYMMQNG